MYKRYCIALIATSLMLCSYLRSDQTIHISDPNLERVIREALGSPANQAITVDDMATLNEIVGRGRGITHLSGLEYARNLTTLILRSNHIVDISPIASLTQLERLILLDNQIQDIGALSPLTRLVELNIRENNISDLSPLAHLHNLEGLDVSKCNIVDVSPLRRMPNLKGLQINHNKIIDAAPLAEITSLTHLEIHNNLIVNIQVLDGLSLEVFYYDQQCDMPPLPLEPRLASLDYPNLLAATWQWPPEFGHDMPFGPSDQLFDVEHHHNDGRLIIKDLDRSIQRRDDIIANNPNTVFLAIIPWYKRAFFELRADSPLWARDAQGNVIVHNEGVDGSFDYTSAEGIEHIVQMAVDIDRCGLYDGIVFDAWGYELLPSALYSDELQRASRLQIVRRIRENTRPNFLIQVNSNRMMIPETGPYINGLSMETGIPNWFVGRDEVSKALHETESTLSWAESHLREPRINAVIGEGLFTQSFNSQDNARWVRVLTTLSLTYSDGYVMYQREREDWWPFWEAHLGQPVGEKGQLYQDIDGLYIREYTNGWAVYNHSGEAQVITLPEEVKGVASGHLGTEHALPNLDGEMYLRVKPTNPADVNGDGVVNILDLTLVAQGFGTDSLEADVNGDGVVNVFDLVFVANQF